MKDDDRKFRSFGLSYTCEAHLKRHRALKFGATKFIVTYTTQHLHSKFVRKRKNSAQMFCGERKCITCSAMTNVTNFIE